LLDQMNMWSRPPDRLRTGRRSVRDARRRGTIGRCESVPVSDGMCESPRDAGVTKTTEANGDHPMNYHELGETFKYWYAGEQQEREERARKQALAVKARRLAAAERPDPARKQALLPRIAGALGLF
jgi:hypothetical protein